MSPQTAREAPARLKPFLKWAGGKRQLLHELHRFLPPRFEAYHEPFLGSGAVFFDLWHRGAVANRPSRLADINPDLIGCYTAVTTDVRAVMVELSSLAAKHATGGAEHYYQVRDTLFNPRRMARSLAEGPDRGPYPPDLAAMFIYLNRTGYNGLFRLNARGEFNVPAGRYASPRICDEATLRAVAGVLGDPRVEIVHAPYASVLTAARPGDFIYLDPPYAPLSPTARFTSYTMTSFSDGDQRDLHQMVLDLAARGCFVVLSNSTAPLVAALYDTPAARRAGLRAYRVSARRAINSHGARRGEVEEFIISNVAPRG